MEKLSIWNSLQKTDPKYTKQAKIKGGMNITAINATYQAKRMTETFGVCGIGWGIKNPIYSIVDLSDDFHDKTLFFTAELFYIDKSVEGIIPISAEVEIWNFSQKYKNWSKNNDIYKKVKTDAMTKGFSLLGLSSDVFMGMYDDNKYLNQVKQEFEEKNTEVKPELQEKTLTELKNVIVEAKAENQVAAWKKKYNVTTLKNLSEDQAKSIIASCKKHMEAK